MVLDSTRVPRWILYGSLVSTTCRQRPAHTPPSDVTDTVSDWYIFHTCDCEPWIVGMQVCGSTLLHALTRGLCTTQLLAEYSVNMVDWKYSSFFRWKSRCKNLVRIDSVPTKSQWKTFGKVSQLCVDRGLSQHFKVEHKMYCRLAAELSKDWSKVMATCQPRSTQSSHVSFWKIWAYFNPYLWWSDYCVLTSP